MEVLVQITLGYYVLEAQKHQLDKDNKEHKKEKLMWEYQLEMERMKVEAERKRVLLAGE